MEPPTATRKRHDRRQATAEWFGVLFAEPDDASRAAASPRAPACFTDLNLDQLVDAAVEGREDYELAAFFHTPLRTVDAIRYRQAVFRDLDGTPLARRIAAFGERMRAVRGHLAQAANYGDAVKPSASKLRNPRQQQAWTLDAAAIYVDTVTRLARDLDEAPLDSLGLNGLRDHVSRYVDSDAFRTLHADTSRVRGGLAAIRYGTWLSGGLIRVRRHDGEPDYGAEIEHSFARFRQGAVGDHRAEFPDWPSMNHVEEEILERVVQLYPDEFVALDGFSTAHHAFMDPGVAQADRELQFYLAYLDVLRPVRAAGLPFCHPAVSADSKAVCVSDTFDVVLAATRAAERRPVVGNDVVLHDPERIIVVTGPNQGGKTTFARTFGQLHYLALLGCPVPGRDARLFLADEVFTHFERGENLADLRGKLEDDLIRIHDVLARATPSSVVIVNEIFTSTTLRDAVVLGANVLDELTRLDALGVCVTFVDELAALNDKTVSMVAGVAPDDPSVRTFKIERRRADGRAYAVMLADKYGLSYQRAKERLAR